MNGGEFRIPGSSLTVRLKADTTCVESDVREVPEVRECDVRCPLDLPRAGSAAAYITEYVVTEYVVTEYVVTKYVVTEYVVSGFSRT